MRFRMYRVPIRSGLLSYISCFRYKDSASIFLQRLHFNTHFIHTRTKALEVFMRIHPGIMLAASGTKLWV